MYKVRLYLASHVLNSGHILFQQMVPYPQISLSGVLYACTVNNFVDKFHKKDTIVLFIFLDINIHQHFN